MNHRWLRTFAPMLGCACTLLTPLLSAGAEKAAKDPFSAMRVRRILPPVPAAKLVLHSADGRPIRLSDYRGKAVLVEFFLAN
jgi:hypothetical protein